MDINFRIFFFFFHFIRPLHTAIALIIDKWSLAVCIFPGQLLASNNNGFKKKKRLNGRQNQLIFQGF
jgi:hypothetical protein